MAWVKAGFLDAPLVVPQFVIEELQALSDSSDKLKCARGRRGLTMVSKLQASPQIDISIDNADIPRKSVDHMLVDLARTQSLRILTTDYNLNKVAQIHGVTVLNMNDLANNLKSQAVPGETLVGGSVQAWRSATQGVGYMPDGTMVVIEDAAERIGKMVTLTVTNSLQTTAGRMIFGQFDQRRLARTTHSHVDQMAKARDQPAAHASAATVTSRANGPRARGAGDSRRNPRR